MPIPLLFTSGLHAFSLLVLYLHILPRVESQNDSLTIHACACIIGFTWVYAILYHVLWQCVS